MRPTGIEPVFTPWKGIILPLNYERLRVLLHSCWRYFFSYLNAPGRHAPPLSLGVCI